MHFARIEQFSVVSKSNQRECIGFGLLSPVVGPENERHLPSRNKTKTKRDLVTRLFPRFRQFPCFQI